MPQQTKTAKYLLLATISIWHLPKQTVAQTKDASAISFLVGYQANSGLSVGFDVRNISHSPIGVYVQSQYGNRANWGGPEQTNEHYNSSLGWTMSYDTVTKQRKSYGTTGGLTLNLGRIFGKRNVGLSLMLGGGVIVSNVVEYNYYSTRYYNNPLLDPTDENYYEVKRGPSRFAWEAVLAYDMVREGGLSFSLYGGYNSGGGVQMGILFGFRTESQTQNNARR